jgi:hypothetical protein
MRRLNIIFLSSLLLAGCGDRPTTTTSSRKEEERAHPDMYLKVNYEVHRNLVGKKVVEGEIINTGKFMTYKTVTLRIVSIKNGNETSVPYTVSDAIAPGGKADFKFKPEGNPEQVKVVVTGASAD